MPESGFLLMSRVVLLGIPGRPAGFHGEFLSRAVEPQDEMPQEVTPEKHFRTLVSNHGQLDRVPVKLDSNKVLGTALHPFNPITLNLNDALGHQGDRSGQS